MGECPCARSRFVLRFHHARQRAHQDAAFAGQVAVDFVLEGGREQVARADGDAQRQGALPGAPGVILVDGIASC